MEKELAESGNHFNENLVAADVRDAAMGKGDEELYEKKLSKEEKKALAKAKRDAKKKVRVLHTLYRREVERWNCREIMSACDRLAMYAKQYSLSLFELQEKGGKKGKVVEEKKEQLDVPEGPPLSSKERKHLALLEQLHQDEIAVTYEAKRGGQHANARDINVGGVSVNFHGRPLIEETEIVINYGNRYGFIGPNGSGTFAILRLNSSAVVQST